MIICVIGDYFLLKAIAERQECILKRSLSKRKHRIFITASVTFLLAVIVVLVSVHFAVISVRDNVFEQLRATAGHQTATVSAKLDGKFDVLRAMAYSFSEDGTDREKVISQMNAAVQSGAFVAVGRCDRSGYVYNSVSRTFSVADREYFKPMSWGRESITRVPVAALTDSPGFVLTAPIPDGSGMVLGLLDEEAFSNLLVSEAFSGNGYSYVIDGSGKVVFHDESSQLLGPGDNLFEYFISLGEVKDYELIQADMVSGVSGFSIYKASGGERYVTYMPLGVNDWYLFSALSGEDVNVRINSSVRGALVLSAMLGVIFAAFIAYIIISSLRTERKIAAERYLLRQSEEINSFVLEFSDTVIFEADFRTDTLKFNNNYEKVFGISPMLSRLSDTMRPVMTVYPDDAEEFVRLGTAMNNGEKHGAGDYRIIGADGKLFWHRLEFQTVYDSDGKPRRVIGKIANVDAVKKTMQNLQIRAESDSLTGLCNNSAFRAKVEDFLSGAGAAGKHAFFIFDIDHFKELNDTLGHPEGDRLLSRLGERVPGLFRTTDFIGRIGGDEFALFLRDLGSESRIHEKATELCRLVDFLSLPDSERRISCSLGISLYPSDGSCFEELYKTADAALYAAKQGGRARFVMYKDIKDSDVKKGE